MLTTNAATTGFTCSRPFRPRQAAFEVPLRLTPCVEDLAQLSVLLCFSTQKTEAINFDAIFASGSASIWSRVSLQLLRGWRKPLALEYVHISACRSRFSSNAFHGIMVLYHDVDFR